MDTAQRGDWILILKTERRLSTEVTVTVISPSRTVLDLNTTKRVKTPAWDRAVEQGERDMSSDDIYESDDLAREGNWYQFTACPTSNR